MPPSMRGPRKCQRKSDCIKDDGHRGFCKRGGLSSNNDEIFLGTGTLGFRHKNSEKSRLSPLQRPWDTSTSLTSRNLQGPYNAENWIPKKVSDKKERQEKENSTSTKRVRRTSTIIPGTLPYFHQSNSQSPWALPKIQRDKERKSGGWKKEMDRLDKALNERNQTVPLREVRDTLGRLIVGVGLAAPSFSVTKIAKVLSSPAVSKLIRVVNCRRKLQQAIKASEDDDQLEERVPFDPRRFCILAIHTEDDPQMLKLPDSTVLTDAATMIQISKSFNRLDQILLQLLDCAISRARKSCAKIAELASNRLLPRSHSKRKTPEDVYPGMGSSKARNWRSVCLSRLDYEWRRGNVPLTQSYQALQNESLPLEVENKQKRILETRVRLRSEALRWEWHLSERMMEAIELSRRDLVHLTDLRDYVRSLLVPLRAAVDKYEVHLNRLLSVKAMPTRKKAAPGIPPGTTGSRRFMRAMGDFIPPTKENIQSIVDGFVNCQGTVNRIRSFLRLRKVQ